MNNIKPNLIPLAIGSFPYLDPAEAFTEVISHFNRVPLWPQLPRFDDREQMYIQYHEGIPGIYYDEKKRKLYAREIDDEFFEKMAEVLTHAMEGNADYFAISRENARGFYHFIDNPGEVKKLNPLWIKGQVTGPVSFALTVTDGDMKPILYDDSYRELVVNVIAMKAAWQVERMREIHPDIIIFIDEPYLANVGSSMVALSPEEATVMIRTVADVIRDRGALSGVHCCGNTDWNILFDSGCHIISMDAYEYGENFLLYGDRIVDFINNGGFIAWGIVPTSEAVRGETAQTLADRLNALLSRLEKKGISREKILEHSFISPSCGLGNLEVDLADLVMKTCRETSEIMAKKD